jgi:osmotically inducible protein OsmC
VAAAVVPGGIPGYATARARSGAAASARGWIPVAVQPAGGPLPALPDTKDVPAPPDSPDQKTEAEMARVLYTAEATVTGGRAAGHGQSTDGALDVQLRAPAEMGGEGGGTNPEQLFAVGFAACFESALGVVGRREHAEVGDVSIDSRVSLLPTEERGFKLAVELDVTLPQVPDPEQAVRLVAAAHEVCPYSNATRGNIDVTVTANGHGIS